MYDAIVIGAGPNGLAAAITLAKAGRSVIVYEAADTVGGGCRSKELTLPGFVHDVCSAIYPLGVGSLFLRSLPLEQYGLEWIHPPIPLAHPFDDGSVAVLERSISATAVTLGCDARAYEAFMSPLVAQWDRISEAFLGPLRLRPLLHPLALVPFALAALSPSYSLARGIFRGKHARGLLAGLCAHSMLRLEQMASAAPGLMLGMAAHVVGWPFPRGGAQQIAEALATYLRFLGGEVVTGVEIAAIDELAPARAVLCDITPRQLLRLAAHHLPVSYQRSLERFRYGPGSFKIDYALDGPIPWRSELCSRAGTVHLGCTLNEIALSERQVAYAVAPERPYVLVAQQSLFDATRAPDGKQTAWIYCHVPHGSTCDMTTRIEAQIERFAPGFRDRVLARHISTPADLECYNANYIGGDINGGLQNLWQVYARPTARLSPYTTPNKRIFLCSSSTPPGGGVHGLCGYFAAQAVLRAAL
jgi:phytoene dehydrogenase-like protein